MAGPLVKTTSRQAPQVAQPVEAPWVNPWDEEIRKHMERLSATTPQPMYSPEEIQQRRQDNNNDYELGLLGTLSGHKGLQSAGGLVLKNAMEQRQRKITEHGSSDQISGEFTYDPDYKQQLEENKLDAMQKLKMSADLKHDADEKDAQLKRDLANQRGDLAVAVKGLGAAGAQGGIDASRGRAMNQENTMYDDFNRETKQATARLDSYKTMTQIAKGGKASDDVALIFWFMKMLDPTSTVNASEYANASNTAGVPDRIRNAYNKARDGTFLNPQQRLEFLGTAGAIAREAQKSFDSNVDSFGQRATSRGLDPDQVTNFGWRDSAARRQKPAQQKPQQQPQAPAGWGPITKE